MPYSIFNHTLFPDTHGFHNLTQKQEKKVILIGFVQKVIALVTLLNIKTVQNDWWEYL